jgi:aminopeptidase N
MILLPTSGIKKQDGARAFASIAKNAFGYELAYDFIYTNIDEIVK